MADVLEGRIDELKSRIGDDELKVLLSTELTKHLIWGEPEIWKRDDVQHSFPFKLTNTMVELQKSYLVKAEMENMVAVRDFIYGQIMSSVGIEVPVFDNYMFEGMVQKPTPHVQLSMPNISRKVDQLGLLTRKELLTPKRETYLRDFDSILLDNEAILPHQSIVSGLEHLVHHFRTKDKKLRKMWIQSTEKESVSLRADIFAKGVYKDLLYAQLKEKRPISIATKIATQLFKALFPDKYETPKDFGKEIASPCVDNIRMVDFGGMMFVGLYEPYNWTLLPGKSGANNVVHTLKENISRIPSISVGTVNGVSYNKDYYQYNDAKRTLLKNTHQWKDGVVIEKDIRAIHSVACPTQNAMIGYGKNILTLPHPVLLGDDYSKYAIRLHFKDYYNEVVDSAGYRSHSRMKHQNKWESFSDNIPSRRYRKIYEKMFFRVLQYFQNI